MILLNGQKNLHRQCGLGWDGIGTKHPVLKYWRLKYTTNNIYKEKKITKECDIKFKNYKNLTQKRIYFFILFFIF